MKNKIVSIIAKIVWVIPGSRKIGAVILTILKKLSGGKSPSFVVEFKQREAQIQRMNDYSVWFHNNYPRFPELEKQKDAAKRFEYQPKISILVPTYNTEPDHLQECIESVQSQTYFNWELCIADDASPNKDVVETIKQYAAQDDRIKLVKRKQNGHICKATNSALEVATGDYVSLLDHDDILWPNALYEVVSVINKNREAELIYTDEDKLDVNGMTHIDPFFKPDWNPDYLRTINYITHFSTLKRELIDEIDGFREGTHGAQDWDLFLRATEKAQSENIHHIPKIVYSWRKSPASTAMSAEAKDYAYVNQKKVLKDDLKRRGLEGEVLETQYKGYWRVKHAIEDSPKVSIVIPTLERYDFITSCVNSIIEKSTYDNYEIVIVDTGSTDSKVLNYYEQITDSNENVKVINWKKEFNFASVCNYGAKEAEGDYLLFLNNDTEVISEDWIESMLEHAQREQTGAVGSKLLFADNSIQHAGIILGLSNEESIKGVAGHIFTEWSDESTDHIKALFADSIRDYSAVTAACMMVSKEKFNEVDGFDERFRIAFNDVDFCLKLQNKGYFNVYTPHAKLHHYESQSVGKYKTRGRDTEEFEKETKLMGKKWGWSLIENDPHYNPNLSRTSPYGMIESDPDKA